MDNDEVKATVQKAVKQASKNRLKKYSTRQQENDMHYSNGSPVLPSAGRTDIDVLSGVGAKPECRTANEQGVFRAHQVYMDLRKMAEKTLPAMKSSNDESEIYRASDCVEIGNHPDCADRHVRETYSAKSCRGFSQNRSWVIKTPAVTLVRQTIAQGDVAKPIPTSGEWHYTGHYSASDNSRRRS
jgi:predicted flap endonuclease-1-like 5' DNA nuclease